MKNTAKSGEEREIESIKIFNLHFFWYDRKNKLHIYLQL